MDNKNIEIIRFFYNNDGIKIIDERVKQQLRENDRDALDFLRTNNFVHQSNRDGTITVTRYGREIVELSRRERQLLKLQETTVQIQQSNNSIQERLKLVQYAMALIALFSAFIALLNFLAIIHGFR